MLLATCVNTPIYCSVFHNLLHIYIARCSVSCVNGAWNVLLGRSCFRIYVIWLANLLHLRLWKISKNTEQSETPGGGAHRLSDPRGQRTTWCRRPLEANWAQASGSVGGQLAARTQTSKTVLLFFDPFASLQLKSEGKQTQEHKKSSVYQNPLSDQCGSWASLSVVTSSKQGK